ncbi:MAG: tail-collar fiber protein [Bacteriophage sp.]|jgi:phage-related tail fiber protein|nr:MAG: tail-collar fiber protein [Bacteriophage sp.]
MPDQERKYGTKITTAGATLITNCILAGTKLKITQAAAGDGGGSYYVPSTEQTELVRELWRGPIVSAEQNPTVPNMMDVKIIIDDSVGNFIVREMGLFDEDGTLIAICNTPDTEKVAISTGVDGRLTMLMHIVVVDSSVLEFTVTASLDTVSPEDLEAAIAEHNTDPASHADIRQDIVDAVSEHDTDTNSHPDIRVTMAGIDSRLSTLELKYGTNVTGNSFEVTFETLTGLVVTGVWNETYARIEF